jgi:hypothetical protein
MLFAAPKRAVAFAGGAVGAVVSITGVAGKSMQLVVQVGTGRSSVAVVVMLPSPVLRSGGLPASYGTLASFSELALPASGGVELTREFPVLWFWPAEQQIATKLPSTNPIDVCARMHAGVSGSRTFDQETNMNPDVFGRGAKVPM